MQKILKANELPPGARMMGRQGRALTGVELAEGLAGLATREVDELAGQSCLGQAKGQWWYGLHLTFPRARVEWVPCKEGIWIKLLLGTGKEWEFRWQDREADIRDMREIGPFASPDDFREALGLARIAQFKLPGGDVVTAELPESALKPIEMDHRKLSKEAEAVVEEVDRQMKELVEDVEREIIDLSANVPEAELLAEPPSVEPSEPVLMKAKPVGAALKGRRKRK